MYTVSLKLESEVWTCRDLGGDWRTRGRVDTQCPETAINQLYHQDEIVFFSSGKMTALIADSDTDFSGIHYLATPYSNEDSEIEHKRFNDINGISARLFQKRLMVFSPISHSHPIKQVGCLPGDWEFWNTFDRCIIRSCESLIVYRADGWDSSIGVREEIKIAESFSMDIYYIDP